MRTNQNPVPQKSQATQATQATLFSIYKKEMLTVRLEDIEAPAQRPNNKTKKSIGFYKDVYDAITLRKEGNRYHIIDGIGRYWSAKEAGIEMVPAMVIEGDDTALTLLGVSLNLNRSPNLIGEARMLQEAMEQGNVTLDMLANMGLDKNSIKRRLKLLELPPDILEEVGQKISEGLAEKVANLPEDEREGIINSIRAADKRFSSKDLKNLRTSQKQVAGEEIEDLLTQPLIDPLDHAIDYLMKVALANGIGKTEIIARLQNLETPPKHPEPAPTPKHPEPAPTPELGVSHA